METLYVYYYVIYSQAALCLEENYTFSITNRFQYIVVLSAKTLVKLSSV